MALQDRIAKMRKDLIGASKPPAPERLQGVSKDDIGDVLASIDRSTQDMVDGVFALLDEQDSWFSGAATGAKFCDGATTAHVGCHVGILQRGRGKLDREGRDYWLKPLWEIGAIEKVYFDSSKNVFIAGHPVPKSPNCAYKLAHSFVQILKAGKASRDGLLKTWIDKEAIRGRLELQARLAKEASKSVDNLHGELIKSCVDIYAPRFLASYEVLYIDDRDGDRISDEQRKRLTDAGITLGLGDAMPDVLLLNPKTGKLWVVEAVTSDGEVDAHKVQQLTDLATRSAKTGVGFTTAYATWKALAQRQAQYKNIAPDTYIWVREDPSKHLKVDAH